MAARMTPWEVDAAGDPAFVWNLPGYASGVSPNLTPSRGAVEGDGALPPWLDGAGWTGDNLQRMYEEDDGEEW